MAAAILAAAVVLTWGDGEPTDSLRHPDLSTSPGTTLEHAPQSVDATRRVESVEAGGGIRGVLLRDMQGTPLAACTYWVATTPEWWQRPTEDRLRRTGPDGEWHAESESPSASLWLAVSPNASCVLVQELPPSVFESTEPLQLRMPIASVDIACLGLPIGVNWSAHAYPLRDRDATQSLVHTWTRPHRSRLPPLRCRQEHSSVGPAAGSSELHIESIEGTNLELVFFADGFRIDAPVQRVVVPSRVAVQALGPQRGFVLRLESADPSLAHGRYVVVDGDRQVFGPLPSTGAFVASDTLGDRAVLSVRRVDGARASVDVLPRECERIGSMTVPSSAFVLPLLLHSEKRLVGILERNQGGRVVRVVLDGPHQRADREVLFELGNGYQVVSPPRAGIVQRLAIAADGQAGDLDASGRVAWGLVVKRRVAPSRLWDLPPGTRSVNLSVAVRSAADPEATTQIEIFERSCEPLSELDLVLTPQLSRVWLSGAAVTEAGLVPLPDLVVN